MFIFITFVLGISSIALAAFILFKTIRLGSKVQNKKQIYVTVVFMFVLGGAMLLINSSERRDAEAKRAVAWETEDNSLTAYVMMQEFVKEQLVSPDSAKFPLSYKSDPDVSVRKEGSSRVYRISGYVDSQNMFGAMVRTWYSGAVEQMDKTRWELESLETGL